MGNFFKKQYITALLVLSVAIQPGCLAPYLAEEGATQTTATTTPAANLGNLAFIQGSYMACIGTTAVWATIVGTKLYQAFVSYAGPGCSGAYTMTVSGPPPLVTEPGYVADVSVPAVTGLPASTFIMRVTNVGSPTPTSDYIIVLNGAGGYYEMGPTSGNYSTGVPYANYTTWADWLANEAEVAGFIADPTGYVPGAGFIRLVALPGSP